MLGELYIYVSCYNYDIVAASKSILFLYSTDFTFHKQEYLRKAFVDTLVNSRLLQQYFLGMRAGKERSCRNTHSSTDTDVKLKRGVTHKFGFYILEPSI